VSGLSTLNTTLGTIGGLSNRIIEAKATGRSTADLENQRDAAIGTLSQLVDVKVLQQPNGDVLITTTAGLLLSTHDPAMQLTTKDVNMLPDNYYPTTVPPIMSGGVDVTSQLRGGQIGANITLRDSTLPTNQAELDEFAQNLASRFHANGLTLFTDPTGDVPPPVGLPPPVQNGYVGFAGTIQVNPDVQADPSKVRDGDAGPTGLAGYTGIINAVLNNTLGDNPPLASNTTKLGPGGNLNAPYSSPTTLGTLASTIVAAQSQDSATTTSQLGTEQTVQTTLGSRLSAQSGVDMDAEMSAMIALQNAYGANAKIISAVQSMWSQLLNTVP
jgi:flagellar hook-associated protein 1 FlgK